MKRVLLLFFFLFAAPVFASEVETVLMVSIDALHPAALGEKTSPTLDRLMRSGRFTLQGQSVTPPQTLIAHTAMMTGLTPEQSGKQDNDWKPGQVQVARETLFDFAKQRGFRTAYFYAKPKLGYLISAAVDEHALARDDGIDRARTFFGKPGRRFVFLHISGLEDEGADAGWLSEDYLDELTYIDTMLAPLLDDVAKRGRYLVLVTSDHAGHERQHGTLHPEDFKLPLIIAASQSLPPLAPGVFNITELKQLLQKTLDATER
ncbi:alkaline phosphatase family protein [Rhodoferax sp.]|uniref:alkaline phosphatase family protein n=1 Tax=Rhodoferax sp. TaxID=50421 RepID=UPI00261E919A|nr:alkaline phosphatase family protein [Rhodoferax sp.]MDD3934973.1 alkaline phosphatase family protein [Rhodoferax sp.]